MNGASEAPLLSIRDLAVSFAGRRAVDGVSLTVYPRQTVAVVGESGSGKSVTAMSVLRLVPSAQVERGAAVWGPTGRDLLTMPDREVRAVRGAQIAMIFQEPMTSLNPVMTIGEQIVEAVRVHRAASRAEARAIAAAALTEVGIADAQARLDYYPHQFSGGMRQRVMIAMALVCEPRLLIADEPTTALDVTVQAQILESLRAIKAARGMGVLLITHDLGVVAENADVVCVMYAGRVVEYAEAGALFARPLHPYTRGLLQSIPRLGLRRDRLVTVADVVENEAEFRPMTSGHADGARPWWPRHAAPVTGAVCVLREAGPGHWVGVWGAEGSGTQPDLRAVRERPLVG